ncbi:MAG TPA: DUF4232 domain-containing protein [Pseudonocardiaceae bacterium]|nr:DUF4232 domain-containing protein [Pseudonocardiaceae bacterium]
MTRHMKTTGFLIGAGALAAVLVTGCAGQTSANGSGSGASVTTSSQTDTSAGSGTGDGTGVPTTVAGGGATAGSGGTGGSPNVAGTPPTKTPECKAPSLKLSIGTGDAATSHDYIPLQFTNVGKATCGLVGFPGVSYVTGDNGQQVGAPAVRDGSIGAQVNLAPGQVAYALVTEIQTGVFDPNVCKPTTTRGLRVYAPDDTASLFIAQSGTGCAGSPPDAQLHVATIKAGPGNQS